MAGLVAVGHCHQLPHPPGRGAALTHPSDLHVAERSERVADARFRLPEDAELVVPGVPQIGIRTFEEGQFGAGRQAAVEGLDAEVAVREWTFLLLVQLDPARLLDAQRADDAPL